ncbi:MAG TPA: diacylglycerol kinase family protein [Kineosporiaceae bacterium]
MSTEQRQPNRPGTSPSAVTARQRWLARLALLAAASAVAVLVVGAGLRSILLLAASVVVLLVILLVAGWWFLAHTGIARVLAVAGAVAGTVTILLLYLRAGLVWEILVCAGLMAVALPAVRAALGDSSLPAAGSVATVPRRPFIIMNPRSGGGKVGRFALAERARELGAQVALLPETGTDVAALARRAVADGADLLGVAGGDGTQALVAGVAAEHKIPFLVVPAGTRNHFALDLDLDPADPAAVLDALTDGVDVAIDLGMIGDRTFVNNASFGVYADVVRSPAYRANKVQTTLDLMPKLLDESRSEPALRVRVGDVQLTSPRAVLVSNNPYQAEDVVGLGRRAALDGGVLGVLAISVAGAREAAGLVRGWRSSAVWRGTAREVIVDCDSGAVAVGVDGESLSLPTPVRCVSVAHALTVRVPRNRHRRRQLRLLRDEGSQVLRMALPGRTGGTPGQGTTVVSAGSHPG